MKPLGANGVTIDTEPAANRSDQLRVWSYVRPTPEGTTVIDHLESSPKSQDVRPTWIEAFLRASHDSALDKDRTDSRFRVRPHPGASWAQPRKLASRATKLAAG